MDSVQSSHIVPDGERDSGREKITHEKQDRGEAGERGQEVLRHGKLSFVQIDLGRIAGATDFQTAKNLELSTYSSRQ